MILSLSESTSRSEGMNSALIPQSALSSSQNLQEQLHHGPQAPVSRPIQRKLSQKFGPKPAAPVIKIFLSLKFNWSINLCIYPRSHQKISDFEIQHCVNINSSLIGTSTALTLPAKSELFDKTNVGSNR